MKLTDGTKTVEITMKVWEGSGWSPCWEKDFFEAGGLPYDEETDTYECAMNLDMDEYERFLASGRNRCPYFRVRDEYRIVRKQN